MNPGEAVRAYHGVLQGRGIKPHRSLEDDLRLTDQAMSYDGSASRRATAEVRDNPLAGAGPAAKAGSWPTLENGAADFERMTAAQRRAYHHSRLARKFD